MSYLFYEIWAEDETGHQELIDTTSSEKEAEAIAQEAIESADWIVVMIYKENEDGDLIEIKRLLT
jgi:hypothetical protein